jgi:hypothetical protein
MRTKVTLLFMENRKERINMDPYMAREQKRMEKLHAEAEEWVFDKNGHKWSSNDDTAGDNYGSFLAGAQSKHVEREVAKAKIEILQACLAEHTLNPEGFEERTKAAIEALKKQADEEE